MIESERVRTELQRMGGGSPRVFAAPGRVNLIGEHTDYNDGFVLPLAIDKGTVVAASPRVDRIVRARSINAGETVELDLDRPGPKRRGHWIDYVEGTAQALELRGVRLVGTDMVLESDVPDGAGLSSSAALEISTGLTLLSIANLPIDRIDLALAGQSAEHEYVGTKCGIMDQYIAALGEKDHALLIDCRTLEARRVPLDGAASAIVICDTGVKHALASSEYNKRRSECEQSVEILRRDLPDIRALRDVSVHELERFSPKLPELLRRRARHVVTENTRTLAASEALVARDLVTVGRLMSESHCSLRDDYEVSAPELDVLVDAALLVPGVYGSRMTGGGFGGCTVSLVQPSSVQEMFEKVTSAFEKRFGTTPRVFVTHASSGARELP